MRWKQFFTPVQSMDSDTAKNYLDQKPPGSVTLLDVRQPAEYAAGHIPGAKLIPLPDIKDRMDELDPDKPTVVYCAIGGRSRVAAQMLAGANFREVINLSGGFKAWQNGMAVGPEDFGMELFKGSESADKVLIVAYSLEKGLREFYLTMIPQVNNPRARELFEKLAAIEIHHQDRIFTEYCTVTGTSPERAVFDKQVVITAMEGGLTTDEYMRLYSFDLESAADVIGLAMAIEAQALDMYHRAAENAPDPRSREVLGQIAREEQTHLRQLGELFDQL